MEILFLTRNDEALFEEETTIERLRSIAGVYDSSTQTIGDAFSACFDYAGDSTIVRLSDDLNHISISGTGPASIHLIQHILRVLDTQLVLFDIDFSFQAQLTGSESPGDLESLLME